jgi:predicted SnoaL-like aldol condensation-catalyzing enzyme
MSEQNKAIVRQLVDEIQNGHDLERMPAYFEPNFVNHLDEAGPDSPLTSVERAQAMFQGMFAAFPDLRVTILDQLAEGDRVVTHKLFEGTHQGAFMGVPPTGQPIRFAVIDILRLRDGKVVEHWAMQDRLSLMQQLGLA